MSEIRFYSLTQAQYDAIGSKSSDALYFTTDTHRLFRGSAETAPSGAVALPGENIQIAAGETWYNIYAFGAVNTTWNGEFGIRGTVYGCYCLGATVNMYSGYICNALVTAKTYGQTSWEGGLQISGGTIEHVTVEGGHMYLYGSTCAGYDIEVCSGAKLMISGDNAVADKVLVRSGGRLQLYKGSALNVTAESGAVLSISDGTTITYT